MGSNDTHQFSAGMNKYVVVVVVVAVVAVVVVVVVDVVAVVAVVVVIVVVIVVVVAVVVVIVVVVVAVVVVAVVAVVVVVVIHPLVLPVLQYKSSTRHWGREAGGVLLMVTGNVAYLVTVLWPPAVLWIHTLPWTLTRLALL